MHVLQKVLDPTLWQYRDPVNFLKALQRTENRRDFLARVWLLRLIVSSLVLSTLTLLSSLVDQPWPPLIGIALLIPTTLLAFGGLATMYCHYAHFWLLYVTAPSVWFIVLLSGMLSLPPISWHAGWLIGLAYLIGLLIADSMTVWANRRKEETTSNYLSKRSGGPAAELPSLHFRHRAYRFRLYFLPPLMVGCVVCFGLTFTLPFIAGYVHLDAILLSLFVPEPLVRRNQIGTWHTNYIGRNALIVPARHIIRLFETYKCAQEQSRALLTLMEEGYLGPTIRRNLPRLSLKHQQQILFQISILEGGAAVLDYLVPSLQDQSHNIGRIYASLAREASKPVDLQRWLHVLTGNLVSSNELEVLKDVKEALLPFHSDIDRIRKAIENLKLFAERHNADSEKLCPSAKSPSESTQNRGWPNMLIFQLERYMTLLLMPED